MSAGWAYADEGGFENEVGPTWSCPDATCRCDVASSNQAEVEHRIVLFDENGVRMPLARCRVRLGRKVINDDMPHADESGVVIVRIPPHAADLLVEWAPSSMPQAPLYPFRCRYLPSLDVEPEEATRRSLHNLGYATRDSLRENVVSYLESYRRPPSPDWQHVADEMVPFHDGGLLPPIPEDDAARSAFVLAVDAPEISSELALVQGDSPNDDPPGGGAGGSGGPFPQPHHTGFRKPHSGGVGNPPLRRLRIEVKSAVVLTVEPKKFLRLVAGTTVTFDGSELTPPITKATFTADANGRLDVVMPSAEGKVKLFVSPPARWLNSTGRPAGPELGAGFRDAADAALDTVSNRRQPFKQRHDAEKALLELEREKTRLVLADSSQQAVSEIEAGITEARRQIHDARRELRRRAHEANNKFAAAVPEFLFRPFQHEITLGPGGRVQLRSRVLTIGDPPFVKLTESSGRIQVSWSPDWVRTPAYRIAWQRPISESAVVSPKKGLGGESMLVLHATGKRLNRDGSAAGPMSLLFAVATFTANAITAQNSRPTRNDNDDTSVHYLVARNGHVIKMVDERFGASHAGGTIWRRHKRVNARSVGIEILNDGTVSDSYRPAQIRAIVRLTHEIMGAFSIFRRNVVGHGELEMVSRSDNSLATNRLLSDPGRHFFWAKLAEEHLTFARIEGLPVAKLGPPASAAKIRLVKQRMLALGYAMSKDNRAASELDGTVDTPFDRAYLVFQLRWQVDPQKKPRKVTPPPDEDTADRIIAGIDAILASPFRPRVL